MEFVDNCIEIKIKRYREIHPESLFSKSYTEYEIKTSLHSLIILEYRRYSQFRDFRDKLSLQFLESLPPFPKKKLLKKGQKLSEQRRQLLEKWLQAILAYREYQEILCSFLGIPEKFSKIISISPSCKLTSSEKSVARLLRDFSKVDKNRSKYLKAFDKVFFSNTESSLSQSCLISLLNLLVPLCGSPNLACLAIDLVYRMVRIECYRYAEEVRRGLFMNLELLKEMKIDQHILNLYSQETGQQGFYIAKLMKEYFDRNGMVQCFKYSLNFNTEAYEMFCVKIEGKPVTHSVSRLSSGFAKNGEWRWLNTDNYPGGLKVCFRKMETFFEVKAEIFIEGSLGDIGSYLMVLEKRREWDLFLEDIRLIKKVDDRTFFVIYTLKIDKKKNLDLGLEVRRSDSLGKVLLTFRSSADETLNLSSGNQKMEIGECYYELQNVDVKVRRSSSSTDEYISDDESKDSMESCKSALMLEKKSMSKLNVFLKMKPEIARLFVNDLSEETSFLKESLVSLKKVVEDIKF